MLTKGAVFKILSVGFGALFSYIGFVNIFWGNDPYFGLFIFTASLFYYFPIIDFIRVTLSLKNQTRLKFALGFLILWASLGVGELMEKIALMLETFPMPNITGL